MDDDNDDVVVLSDEEDDQELKDMASAAAAQGILAGQMEPDIDEDKMKQKFCDISTGSSMVIRWSVRLM